jgi:hypothetical protein
MHTRASNGLWKQPPSSKLLDNQNQFEKTEEQFFSTALMVTYHHIPATKGSISSI